jgi:hypothetical protein
MAAPRGGEVTGLHNNRISHQSCLAKEPVKKSAFRQGTPSPRKSGRGASASLKLIRHGLLDAPQLCAHLNSVARHASGWDILQFRVEETDEVRRGRKTDLVAAPLGTGIIIEGRRYIDFDTLMPIECKRLPTPAANNRDEMEYVFSHNATTGGIQRFKDGFHGAAHTMAAMIGYIQDNDGAFWNSRIAAWIVGLAGVIPGWSTKDLLRLLSEDAAQGVTTLSSTHERPAGLPAIELRHLWIEMTKAATVI